MRRIEKEDFERLRKANLLRDLPEKNYMVTNKNKKSSRKKYFIVEEKKLLAFLGLLKK